MARRELRRKITATVLTVTALCCLLGVCAWLLLGSNVFSDTIRIMMLVCTVVLGVATIGLLVAKVQEIRALREIIRSEDAQQQSEAETPRPELAPLQTLDHTTIELPPLPDIPAPAAQPAPKQAKQQPKTKQGRSKKRGRAMEQPAAETMAPAQPVLQHPMPLSMNPRVPHRPLRHRKRLRAKKNAVFWACSAGVSSNLRPNRKQSRFRRLCRFPRLPLIRHPRRSPPSSSPR